MEETKKRKQITIDLEAIGHLVKDADQILLSPEGERNLLKILEAQEALEEFRKEAEELIEQRAKELDPSFNIIRGDQVKVQYRSYGSRYAVDESHVDQLAPSLFKRSVKYSPITKEVDHYYEENGSLPLGIMERDTNKKIYIQRVKAK